MKFFWTNLSAEYEFHVHFFLDIPSESLTVDCDLASLKEEDADDEMIYDLINEGWYEVSVKPFTLLGKMKIPMVSGCKNKKGVRIQSKLCCRIAYQLVM